MGNLPDMPPISAENGCPLHTVLNIVCGGPHRVVRTDLGDEVLAPSETPIGTPANEVQEEFESERAVAAASEEELDSDNRA